MNAPQISFELLASLSRSLPTWQANTLATAALVYTLWVFYLAIMNLRRAKLNGTLQLHVHAAALPALAVGLLLDMVVNLTLVSFLLWEKPKELTVTRRLKRHMRSGNGWRYQVVRPFVPFLDPFDPDGRHITEAEKT